MAVSATEARAAACIAVTAGAGVIDAGGGDTGGGGSVVYATRRNSDPEINGGVGVGGGGGNRVTVRMISAVACGDAAEVHRLCHLPGVGPGVITPTVMRVAASVPHTVDASAGCLAVLACALWEWGGGTAVGGHAVAAEEVRSACIALVRDAFVCAAGVGYVEGLAALLRSVGVWLRHPPPVEHVPWIRGAVEAACRGRHVHVLQYLHAAEVADLVRCRGIVERVVREDAALRVDTVLHDMLHALMGDVMYDSALTEVVHAHKRRRDAEQ